MLTAGRGPAEVSLRECWRVENVLMMAQSNYHQQQVDTEECVLITHRRPTTEDRRPASERRGRYRWKSRVII